MSSSGFGPWLGCLTVGVPWLGSSSGFGPWLERSTDSGPWLESSSDNGLGKGRGRRKEGSGRGCEEVWVVTCFGRFWHVLTCSEQKSGRPIFGVFVKHVVELYSLVKTEHVKLCEVRALDSTIVHL